MIITSCCLENSVVAMATVLSYMLKDCQGNTF